MSSIDKHCTVHDFDGVFTDVEREGAPFGDKFQAEFAATTGLPLDEVKRIWEIARKEILASPGDFGWKNEQGLIVAPATADPYLIATAITQLLFDKLLANPNSLQIEPSPTFSEKIPAGPVERRTLLEGYFGRSYAGLKTVMQPGAAEFLWAVADVSKQVIVGNAAREKLLQKLGTLGKIPDVPVIGHAGKNKVDMAWTGAPESMSLPGLDRPVWLRRKAFHDALTAAGALNEGVNACAIGDIWELDLALPEQLGFKVGLMARSTTPTYELQHLKGMAAGGRAAIARNLEELWNKIKDFYF